MNSLALRAVRLPAMSDEAIHSVHRLQSAEAELPQVPLDTQHVLHAGLYARTLRLPDGVEMTAALIKRPTLVIVVGDALVWLGAETHRLSGHNVLPASAGRKQVFFALTETFITMVFPTDAKTVEEAEAQFTDEASLLASRREDAHNTTVITGE